MFLDVHETKINDDMTNTWKLCGDKSLHENCKFKQKQASRIFLPGLMHFLSTCIECLRFASDENLTKEEYLA